ncbi:unnamed protein product [Natator depressus]
MYTRLKIYTDVESAPQQQHYVFERNRSEKLRQLKKEWIKRRCRQENAGSSRSPNL